MSLASLTRGVVPIGTTDDPHAPEFEPTDGTLLLDGVARQLRQVVNEQYVELVSAFRLQHGKILEREASEPLIAAYEKVAMASEPSPSARLRQFRA